MAFKLYFKDMFVTKENHIYTMSQHFTIQNYVCIQPYFGFDNSITHDLEHCYKFASYSEHCLVVK